jgi:hypothetical protein
MQSSTDIKIPCEIWVWAEKSYRNWEEAFQSRIELKWLNARIQGPGKQILPKKRQSKDNCQR